MFRVSVQHKSTVALTQVTTLIIYAFMLTTMRVIGTFVYVCEKCETYGVTPQRIAFVRWIIIVTSFH